MKRFLIILCLVLLLSPAVSASDGEVVPSSYILVPIAAGFIIGLITVCVMASKLKSVRFKSNAEEYVKDPLSLTQKSDVFLWRSVTRTRIQTNKNKR